MTADRRLRDALPEGRVIDDPAVLAAYTTDWTGRFRGAPTALVRPGDADEVATVIGWARRHRRALVPVGGHTGLVGATAAPPGAVLVSTSRLDAITDVDADAGQLTAGAGATVAAVQRTAADCGWRYGVDFAARDSATVGGTIATDAGGVRVLRYGSTRAQVIGVEAVLGTGVTMARLSGLVKDNTGFDLAGLLCGSEGTLGIVTRARLRLVPPAGDPVTALVAVDGYRAAVSLAGHLRRSVRGLEALEVMGAAGVELVAAHLGHGAPVTVSPVVVLVEAEGPEAFDALGAAVGDAEGVRDVAVATDGPGRAHLWSFREAHTEAIAMRGPVDKFDVTLPMPALADFADRIGDRVGAEVGGSAVWVFGHLGDGNLHVNVTGARDEDRDTVAAVVLSAALAHGGAISAEHGIGRSKVTWLPRDRGPGDVATMRAIKGSLDPDGILNPGVLFPPG